MKKVAKQGSRRNLKKRMMMKPFIFYIPSRGLGEF